MGIPTLSVLIILGGPKRALAQDCGFWSRPVLCETELVATVDTGHSDRLGARSRYRIAPRGEVSLELKGLDLRVTVRSETGRCRVQAWVPGNLNFEWEIEFEVDPRARTSHSRTDCQYVVGALYAGILDRDPDPQSQRSAVAEVRQGNLQSLIGSMVRSREFARSRIQCAARRPARPVLPGHPRQAGGHRRHL